MMGKKSTCDTVRDKLSGLDQVTRIQSTVLVQGSTRRWVIAWSFIPGIRTAFDASKKRKRDAAVQVKKPFTSGDESLNEIYLYIKNDLKLDASVEESIITVRDVSKMTWLKDHLIKGKPVKPCLPFTMTICNSDIKGGFECVTSLSDDSTDSHQIKGYFNSLVTHLARRKQK